jgi:hypothetical protein
MDMLDTVIAYLGHDRVGGGGFLAYVPKYLDWQDRPHYSAGNRTIKGGIKNLDVYVTDASVYISGSIAKYYFGDNLHNLNRRQVEDAFNEIAEKLHLPIQDARIFRVDIGACLKMDQPASFYLEHLGEMQKVKKRDVTYTCGVLNSITYGKKPIQTAFYDKIDECRTTRAAVPVDFAGCNALRYERRYYQRIGAYFQVQDVTVSTLYDEGFYKKAVYDWREAFRKIDKMNDIDKNNIRMNDYLTIGDARTIGMLRIIDDAGGEQKFLEQVQERLKAHELDKAQAKNLRDAARQACECRVVGERVLVRPNDGVSELWKKIDDTARQCE